MKKKNKLLLDQTIMEPDDRTITINEVEFPALGTSEAVRSQYRPSYAYSILTRASTPVISGSSSLVYSSLTTQSQAGQSRLLNMRTNLIDSWLNNYPKSNLKESLVLFKPSPAYWLTVLPKSRFIRLRPIAELNSVTCITTYQDMILCGLRLGQIIQFDVNTMKINRVYQATQASMIDCLITGRKANHFFAVSDNQFIEYSYYDLYERFRFRNSCRIISVLYESYPLLLVDKDGFVHEYRNSETDIRIFPIGKLFEGKVSYFEELRSFDANSVEEYRPCLIRYKACIALINLSIYREPKVIIWNKELFSSERIEDITVVCCRESMFYTLLSSEHTPMTTTIYVTPIKDMGHYTDVGIIKTSGYIDKISVSSDYLVAQTNLNQVEIFDTNTRNKLFHFIFGQSLSSALIIRETIVCGTNHGSLVFSDMLMRGEQFCLHCRPLFHLEKDSVQKRCYHFFPQEVYTIPLY